MLQTHNFNPNKPILHFQDITYNTQNTTMICFKPNISAQNIDFVFSETCTCVSFHGTVAFNALSYKVFCNES